MRQDTEAKKLYLGYEIEKGRKPFPTDFLVVSSSTLHKSDLFYVEAGDTIPVDGEVVEGIASVNESAITGERTGDPGVWWRPQRCYWRNGYSVRLAHHTGKRRTREKGSLTI